MKEQIIKTWYINNRVNLKLIDAISDEGFNCSLSKRGGRTVALQFAHLHELRLWKLDRFAHELLGGQIKITKKEKINKSLLKKRLSESADAVAKWFEKVIDDDGTIKGFKRGVVPMLGYLISHESHHRGSILLTLKQCGHKIPKAVSYEIWAWNTI